MGSMRAEASVEVKHPIEEVWGFLTDPLNLPRWSGAWLGARPTSPAPIGLGTTFDGRRVILGVEIRWRGLVTEWRPPRALAYWVQVLGARSGVRITLEATEGGTKVVRGYAREPRPVQRLASRIFGPWLKRSHDAHNEKLRQLLESDLS